MGLTTAKAIGARTPARGDLAAGLHALLHRHALRRPTSRGARTDQHLGHLDHQIDAVGGDHLGAYAEDGYRSVADVTDPESLQKVRDFKKAKKAEAKAGAKAQAG